MKLIPSIASADPLHLGDELKRIAEWPYLHIDIEDGNFIPNITFGMKTVSAICKQAVNSIIDVHLMTTDPFFWLKQLEGKPLRSVSAHIEVLPYPLQFIHLAHSLGMKAGLALNIKTPLSIVEPFLGLADYLLFMTSEPDGAGEELYAPALDRAIKAAIRLQGDVEIYADGGLTRCALRELSKAGAKGAVLGRLVFSAEDPLQELVSLSQFIQKGNG